MAQRKFLRILKNALPPIQGVRRDGHRQFVRDEEALISGFRRFRAFAFSGSRGFLRLGYGNRVAWGIASQAHRLPRVSH